jgi:glucose/arabinose dehydrogenase
MAPGVRMLSGSRVSKSVFLLAGSLLWLPAAAQFTHPDCPELKPAEFKMAEIFNRTGANGAGASDAGLAEPVQFDLHPVKSGESTLVDIYFVERLGKVKRYDAAAKKINTLGSIPTWGKVDNGVMGIALHPDFDNNRWVYIWYAPPIANAGLNRRLKLSRFTLKSDYTLDMASQKDLIDILGSKSDEYHSGGPMQFDGYGDLWVTVGNNSPDLIPDQLNVMSKTDSTQSAEWGPSNTAGLRGSIFRIHPDSSQKGYSVPKGNFGEYWAAEFEKQGKASLANEYRNPAKVLPEIYVKGNRSNYSISVHPVKRWLVWGEVNFAGTNDELNLATHPTFAGFPYFHANNAPTGNHGMSPDAPKNNSPFNSGVTDLPPAMPGTINNLVNVSISGPLYVFDPGLNSKVKFPRHLHNTWISFGHNANQMHIHTLDSVQVKVQKTQRVDNGLFAGIGLRKPLQAKYGPEGALYILFYDGFYNTINPAIKRIDYQGTCNPYIPTSVRPLPVDFGVALQGGFLQVDEAGDHEVRILDLKGAVRLSLKGRAGSAYRLSDLQARARLDKGVHVLQVLTPRGTFTRNLSLL